jgi:hypothetical protein
MRKLNEPKLSDGNLCDINPQVLSSIQGIQLCVLRMEKSPEVSI